MKQLFLLLILQITFSCSTSQNDLYKFDPNNLTEQKLSLSQIAEDIIYIPLDNNYKIRLINNIIFTNRSIFISSDEGVLKFSREGKFVNKIGNKGRGPGEYIYCSTFSVNDKNETVYIKDRDNLIRVYSKNGIYLREIKLQDIGSGIDLIEFYNSNLFISYFQQFGESKYNWSIIDTMGAVLKNKERTSPKFESNWLEESRAYRFDNQLFYWNPYNDTVISISNDYSSKPSFLFGKGSYRLPSSSFDPTIEITHFMLIKSLFETNRFIVIRYSYNKRGNVSLIDKKNKKTYLIYVDNFEDGGIKNDFDNGMNFQPVSYYSEKDQEYMIGFFNPYQLKSYIASPEFCIPDPKNIENKNKIERLAKSLAETDNPVLILVRLKK